MVFWGRGSGLLSHLNVIFYAKSAASLGIYCLSCYK